MDVQHGQAQSAQAPQQQQQVKYTCCGLDASGLLPTPFVSIYQWQWYGKADIPYHATTEGRLIPFNCLGELTSAYSGCCLNCWGQQDSGQLRRMIDRAPDTDPTIHAPHLYRMPHQLMLAVQHQRSDKEATQLSMVRVQVRLRQIGQALTLHKRLVCAVASGDVPRKGLLISVCVKHAGSVGATMDKIAATQMSTHAARARSK